MRVSSEAIFRKHNRRSVEVVRLDDVRSRLKILPVNIQNDIRPRSNEILIASFERGSAKILRVQVALLQHRPHRPIKHEDSLRQQLAQGFSGLVQIAHLLLEGVTPCRYASSKRSKYPKNLAFPAPSILPRFPAVTYFRALNGCFLQSNGQSGPSNPQFMGYTALGLRRRMLDGPALENPVYRRCAPQPSENRAADARNAAPRGNRSHPRSHRPALRRKALRHFLPPDGHSVAPRESGSWLRLACLADCGNLETHRTNSCRAPAGPRSRRRRRQLHHRRFARRRQARHPGGPRRSRPSQL